jgi:hypothetical protein
LWRDGKPVGTYLYKREQSARSKFREMAKTCRAPHSITFEVIELIWHTLQIEAPSE